MSDGEMSARRLPASFPKKGHVSAKRSGYVQETCSTLMLRNKAIRGAPYSILLDVREREGGRRFRNLFPV